MSCHRFRHCAFTFFLASELLFTVPPTPASAVEQTIVREETYQASEDDSKTSCRQQAIAKLRQKVFDEIGGVYVEKTIREEKKESDQGITSLTTEEKTNIVAVITKIEVVNEQWDGHTYQVRANVRFDQDAIMENLRRIAAERRIARDKQQEIDALKQQQAQQSQLVDQKIKQLDEKAKQLEIESKRKADELTKMVAELKTGSNGTGTTVGNSVTRTGNSGGKTGNIGTGFRRLDKNGINSLIADIRQQCESGASQSTIITKLCTTLSIQ